MKFEDINEASDDGTAKAQPSRASAIGSASDYEKAVEEMRASGEERRRGPRDQCKCPDCGATVRVTTPIGDDWKLYELEFIKHAS
jgi:hypothetical protein